MMQLEIAGARHPIVAGETAIGSAVGCALVLDDLEPRHALIYGSPAGAAIRAAVPDAGILLNGTLLGEGLRPLMHGDRIQIGVHELLAVDASRVNAVAAPAGHGRLPDWEARNGGPAQGPRYASLLVRRGPGKGTRLDVTATDVRIGADPGGSDLVVADPSVTGVHARLRWSEGLWLLADAGSREGTLVDGELVMEEVPLAPGATLRLGDVVLLFESHAEPVSAALPAGREMGRSSPLSSSPTVPAASPSGAVGSSMTKWLIGAVVVLAAAAGAAVGFLVLR